MRNILVFNLLSVRTERIYHPNELNCYDVALLVSNSDTDAAQLPVDPAWLVAALSALVATYQVPGAQLAIHRAGVTVAVEVGGLEHRTGTPVTQETAFPIGSVSKVWPATLTMILIADDDLELDAPLNIHLPELGDLGSKLTLGRLLSYTSGFACSLDMREQSAGSLGRYAREHCRAQDVIFPPGTDFSYSNRNYVVVGRLIEAITGMSWSEAMESILLRPLGVDPTAVVGSTQVPFGRHIVTGHSVNIAVGRTRPMRQSLMLAEAPAAALAMSAVDLVALGLMHIGPGFPELLPASYAELMRQAVLEADPFGLADVWGSGLALFRGVTTDWVGHDGNANGMSCDLRIDPAGGCVVALTTNANTGSYRWDELRIELVRANLSLGAHQRDMSPLDELMLDHPHADRRDVERLPGVPGPLPVPRSDRPHSPGNTPAHVRSPRRESRPAPTLTPDARPACRASAAALAQRLRCQLSQPIRTRRPRRVLRSLPQPSLQLSDLHPRRAQFHRQRLNQLITLREPLKQLHHQRRLEHRKLINTPDDKINQPCRPPEPDHLRDKNRPLYGNDRVSN